MKILIDTNIVLDILLAREPFVEEAREIFLLIENHKIEGFIPSLSPSTSKSPYTTQRVKKICLDFHYNSILPLKI